MISTVTSSTRSMMPLHLYPSLSPFSIVPYGCDATPPLSRQRTLLSKWGEGRREDRRTLKPRYHGCMGCMSSPSSLRRRLATMSAGLKLGMYELHPVPMPSEPLTSTIGSTGMYLLRERE